MGRAAYLLCNQNSLPQLRGDFLINFYLNLLAPLLCKHPSVAQKTFKRSFIIFYFAFKTIVGNLAGESKYI